MRLTLATVLLALAGPALAQQAGTLPAPVPRPAPPAEAYGPPTDPVAPRQPGAAERGGAAIDRAAESTGRALERAADDTGSALGRAMRWTGEQMQGAGDWTARQGERMTGQPPRQ
ncbi:hypothetical protein GXW78_05830 [Roseomonas terrae]|jgi:hypothetical protein|uniref:Uncharacterized protein n=1 Tax=Neoroseomonas terrae TaxID=424799 RepID=A0ABS5EDS4_9PROT|nr:hypothetical protein [Neoroseomonas terrae]MBR0649173.1 hypothetical protein [Neoroseomonas terrae]